MKRSDPSRYALTSCVAAAMLAGCGGSQPPIGAPGAAEQTSAIATATQPHTSKGDLLYATGACGGACVLSYPGGKIVANITLSGDVGGDCSDAAGNVFITNNTQVFEYAHGGTTPIVTLGIPGDNAKGCSTDPTTGNLAVVYYASSGANVAIFSAAAGEPTTYDSHIDATNCGYDATGDLFVAGFYATQSGIAELPYGGSKFSGIAINGKLGNSGQIQWDGAHMAYESRTKGNIKILTLQISGSTGTIIGTARLKGARGNAYQSWLYGGRILVPYGNHGQYANNVGVWKYPQGGNLVDRYQHLGKYAHLDGVTVSVGTDR